MRWSYEVETQVTTSTFLIHCLRNMSLFYVLWSLAKHGVEWTVEADIWQSMWVEALSGQPAKHVKLYLDPSRLKKRELLIAMDSHQWGGRAGGGNFCVRGSRSRVPLMIFVKTTSGKYYTAHVAFELVLILLKNAVVILLLTFPYNIAFNLWLEEEEKHKHERHVRLINTYHSSWDLFIS